MGNTNKKKSTPDDIVLAYKNHNYPLSAYHSPNVLPGVKRY